MKTALITGVNGQDGSYLAELLLRSGYKVFGVVRGKNPKWPEDFRPENLGNLHILNCDLGYPEEILQLFNTLDAPIDEVYNLAAQSHVGDSFKHPDQTYRVTGNAACLLMDYYFSAYPFGRFYQASSSEMFGNSRSDGFHSLSDPFCPASPYAVAKIQAHFACESHRLSGHFAFDGILFNHESERRHESFVTQKICRAAVEAYIVKKSGGFPEILKLGNGDAQRDWGYAPEYVEIMQSMVQGKTPSSVVIGTGTSTSVKEFAKITYEKLGMDFKEFVRFDEEKFLRPYDVWYLCADPIDAKRLLGRDLTTVDGLIDKMLHYEMKRRGV